MDGDSTAAEIPNGNRPVSIFLSYRREDSMYPAHFLWQALQARFGKDQVFIDVSGIRPGSDYAERLLRQVRGSDVLVALIGQRWLTAVDENNRRRLDNPEDWVRKEIAEAIRTDRRVIPVLLEDVRSIPRASQLPPELHRLPRFNAVTLTTDRWDQEVSALIAAIEVPLEPLPMVDWREPTVTTIHVGGRPSSLAFADGTVWVADWATRSVCRINPATNEVLPGVLVGLRPRTIAADEKGVWVYGGWGTHRKLVRIDPASGRVAGQRPTAMFPFSMAVGQGGVWVAYLGRVVRMHPTDPAADQTFRLGMWILGSSVLGDRTRARRIVVENEAVWVATARGEGGRDQAIYRIDPVTGTTVHWDLDISEPIEAIAVGEDEVWAATASRVHRIDLALKRSTTPTPIKPSGIALAEGSLWITRSGDEHQEGEAGGDDQGRPGFLCRIDPARPTEYQEIAVGRDPGAVMVAMGSVWVANWADGTVSRVDRELQSKPNDRIGRT